MSQHPRRPVAASVAATLTLALVGCNNDDDDPPSPPADNAEVPGSAGLSTTALVAFILGLSASEESAESLTIRDSFAVPPEASAEPTPLI